MKRFLALLLCLSAVVYSQTRQVPNLGSSANDGTGDSLRTFGQKVANNESNLFKVLFTNSTFTVSRDWTFDFENTYDFDILDADTLTIDAATNNVIGVRQLNLSSSGDLYLSGYSNLIVLTPQMNTWDPSSVLLTNRLLTLVDPTNGYWEAVSLDDLRGGSGIEASKLTKWSAAKQLVSTDVDISDVSTVVDSVSALVALDPTDRVAVRTLGYTTAGDGGGAVYRWASGYSGTTNALGGALAVSGGAWVQIGDTFDVRQFGATADDDSDDDQDNIEAAFNFMPAGSTLRITGGVYDLGQRISLNTKNDWVLDGEGGTVKIKNPITTASVTVMGIYAVTNARIFGLTVDGNGWTGINGIGIGGKTNSNARDIMVDSVLVRSVTRAPATVGDVFSGGGRGITAQFNCYNILVTGCTVLDSTTGYDVHGNATYPIRGISFVNNVAENCEEGASFYDLLDGNGSPADVSGSQVMVSGLTMLNCGLSTSDLEFGAWPTGTQGGAIVFIRSRGIQMDGIKLWNDPGYGVIGAVLRGTGKYVNVSDLDARADVVSAVWLYKAENTLPLNSATDDLIVPDSFVVSNFRFAGTHTNLVQFDQPTSPAVQNSRFEIISDADVTAFVGGSGSLTAGGDSTVLRAFRRTDSKRVDATVNQIVALANDWSAVPSGGLLQQVSVQNQLTVLQTNSTPTLRFKRVGTSAGEVRMGVIGSELRVYDSGGTTYTAAIATTGGGTVIEPTGVSGAVASSAALDIRSTAKGILPPRMTTAQRANILSPATGLVLYDTDLNKVCVYDGTLWQVLGQRATQTVTTSGGDVTVTGGNRSVYSHYWAADGDADLVFSSVVDGDTGTLLVLGASTNVNLTIASSAKTPGGSPIVVPANEWSVISWENRVINSTNVTLVNLGTYE